MILGVGSLGSMNAELKKELAQAGVAVLETFDGARIELPPRGGQKALGIGLTVVGLIVAVFMVFWMSGPIRGALRGSGAFNVVLLIFGLLGLPGLLAGLAGVIAGLAVWSGRSRATVEVGGGRLRVTERFGPFRYTWKRPIAQIRRFRFGIERAETNDTGAPNSPDVASALTVEGDFPRPLWIAPFYDLALLRPLANALAELVGRGAPARAPVVAVLDSAAPSDAPEPVVPRPARSKVSILELPEGFAVDAPPAGLIRGSHGLIFFAVLWLGMCGLIFGVALTKGASAVPAPFALFAALFIGIGIALLLLAIHLGRRRVMIAANARTLGVRRIGLFGTKEERYPRADLCAVRCGPSGIEVNDRPVMELQFHFHSRKKVGCLAQLSLEELRWLAGELRRRLGAPERPPRAAPAPGSPAGTESP